MFEPAASGAHCRLSRAGARWLSTGATGGTVEASTAANLTVPTDFDRRDLGDYVATRRDRADLPADGPTLLTAVDVENARGAQAGSVTVLATAGLTNPATLPMAPGDGVGDDGGADLADASDGRPPAGADPVEEEGDGPPVGTVNLLVGTTRALEDGTLAELLATAVEAKTATLSATAGVTGTTSDAVAVGCDPAGEPAAFAGSGTPVGRATRACVRDAVRASLDAWTDERGLPDAVAAAEHGTVTTSATESLDL